MLLARDIMGDYDIIISCYFNDTLASIFSGNAFFNGCAIFSGQVKEDRTGIEGKLKGIVGLTEKQIMFNFLKSDNESPVIEFQVCKIRDNQEFLGVYRGAWRYRYGIFASNFDSEGYLWSKRNTPDGLWIDESVIKEKQALIEILPSTKPIQQTYSPEISNEADEANSESVPEQNLNTPST